MNKKISVGLAITIAILAMTVTFSVTMILAGRMFNNTVSSVKEKENMYSKLAEIDKYVRDNAYVEINDETLYDTMASGYVLGTGDRSAVYYTAKAYEEIQDIADGTLMGIGVDVVKDASGSARIIKVYDESPAREAGLEQNGYITAIDGVDVKGLTRENVQSRLRGESGTSVTITYLNPMSEESQITLTRSKYNIPSVEYQLLGSNMGYVQITAFNNNTASQLEYAIHQLTSAGAAGIVFDVRNTAGGSLDAAVECVSLIVPEGDVVSAEYKDGTVEVLGSSDDDELNLPMTVLVNGSTSYSAELFAATVRDFEKGRVVGVKTAGKGTIQASPSQLEDGSAVVITVARMLTSTGECFDGVGVTPDVEYALTSEQEQSFYDMTPDTDPQVTRCCEVLAQQIAQSGAGGEDVNVNEPIVDEGTEGGEDTPAEGGEDAPTEGGEDAPAEGGEDGSAEGADE